MAVMSLKGARHLAAAAGLLALFCGTLSARSQQQLPRAEEIVQKAVARAKLTEDRQPARQYVFKRHLIREELDGDGAVKKREDRVYQLIPITVTARFSRLVEKDGKPLSGDDLRQEQERESKFREAVARPKPESREKPRKPRDNEVKFNEELVGRYYFQVIGRENIHGRPAFVLAVQPRSNDLPVRRTVDRILNRLAGKLWIDEEDYEIARADVHLTEPAGMWGGIAGSLKKLDLIFEQIRTDEGVWLESLSNFRLNGRLLFKSLNTREIARRSDFRKITAELVELSSP